MNASPNPADVVTTLPSPAGGGGEVATIAFLAMIERAARDPYKSTCERPTLNLGKVDAPERPNSTRL
jgi:hypothetical protein